MPNQHQWYKHPLGEALNHYNERYDEMKKTKSKIKKFNIITELEGFINGSVNANLINTSINTYNYTVFAESHSRTTNKSRIKYYRLRISKNEKLSPTLLTSEQIIILKKFVKLLETDEAKKYLRIKNIIATIVLFFTFLFLIYFVLYLNYSSK